MVQTKKSMTDINGIISYLSTQNQNLLFTQNPNAFHYSEQLVALLSFYLKCYPNVSHHSTRTTSNDTKVQHISEALLECKRVYDVSKTQLVFSAVLDFEIWAVLPFHFFFFNDQLYTSGSALHWENYCWSTTSFFLLTKPKPKHYLRKIFL